VCAVERPAPVSETEAAALFADLVEASGLVLAVSGGADSTALMFMAARWRAALERGPKLTVATIDHGLRPESAAEATAVGRLAERLALVHRTLRWTGPKPVTGVQNAARSARYHLLAAAAKEVGAGHVLTAHSLDDQAETVLMRLAHGSGLAGLAGMARISALNGIVLVRPFLDIRKARLVATIEAAAIPFLDDPSNRDPRFLRTRLRQLMPRLAAEGLDAARLALFGRRIARAEAALDQAAAEAMGRLGHRSASAIVLDRTGFSVLSEELRLRLLQGAIGQMGDEGPVELAKLETLVAALAVACKMDSLRRTLAGALITLDADRLRIERAPRRRTRRVGNEPAGTRARGAKAPFTNRR
jgi:tRNA(Ile)-lysidine synthase